MRKYYLYIVTLFALTIVACDPMEDVYDELDEAAGDSRPALELNVRLTDDDYALLEGYGVATYSNFESEDEAAEYIPYILNENFPQLGNGSSINVTYNLYRGSSEAITSYTSAEAYEFEEEEYMLASSEAAEFGFLNSETISEVPTIIAETVQDPADGQMVAITYAYANIAYEDIESVSIYEETFDADIDAYETFSIAGDQNWHWASYSGDGYSYMNGYSGVANENEDYLVSPEIDLTSYSDAVLKLYHAINYADDEVFGEDLVVYISTDYDGNVTSANWENLELDVWPEGDSWTFVNSEVDLADYLGETIHLAFYYTSTTDNAAAWEVSTIQIEMGEPVETSTINEFYVYTEGTNSWSIVDQGVYYLNSDDYDAMGAPGQYDNFSSSVPADDYVPTLLENMYPYAQEEEQMVVIYKYYSSSASAVQTRGNLYTYMNGMWTGYASEVENTLQFVKANGIWEPDNTIRYTLTGSDYAAIAANDDLGDDAARDNLADYGNFNLGNWPYSEIYKSIDFILKRNFPGSAVGQKYLVSYDTYPDGGKTVHLILGEEGNYVEATQ